MNAAAFSFSTAGFSVLANAVTFMPAMHFCGLVQFTYEVMDNNGGTDNITVVLVLVDAI